MDARSLSNIATHPPPPPPSLTICLIFATRTIFYTRSGSISDYMTPQPTESKVFTMDINSFTNQFSASEAINSMFMNTMTGSSFSLERRLWLATTISQTIRCQVFTLDADHFFHLEVVDETVEYLLHEDIEQAEEHFRQDLQEESSFEDHEVEEFYEDVQYLSFCPAPPALVESLKTELYQSDQEGEAEKCMICLEELVARVDQQIRFMFMNTTTGFSWSPERRFWTVATLSESIRHYLHHSNSTLDANIIFQLDVVDEMDEMDEMDEEIEEEEEEHFMQEISEEWLEDEEESFEDHEEEEFSEDLELSICQAAPPALVKSLKTELYQQSDQEGEAEGCMICLEELVARVDQ
ncbi:hypothetical protein J5N97_018757 [Dioscorea zingiberensis]|uniref:Uncharacterized protein n=1 Tax=Dioscorea zingiberensis TaxID=325984 RepID=A0A9D5CCQ6_9LILI|nr:hypothetical protein J5N97_018757 [Dioscorea zingiberensis]